MGRDAVGTDPVGRDAANGTPRHSSDDAALREALADPGLGRILQAFRDRWIRYGRTTGKVRLESWDEVHAVTALTGDRPRLSPGRFLAAETLETALRETRFGCGLRHALEVHFGEPIITHAERREARERAWAETRAALDRVVETASLSDATRDRLRAWIDDDLRELQRRHTQDAARLVRDFEAAILAVSHLPGGERPNEVVALAVLANQVFGQPHELDADSPVASLFYRALSRLHPETAGALDQGAEGRAALLAAAGIARDRTSPRVDVFGLQSDDPALAWLVDHPIMTFSLRSLEALGERRLHAARDTAFVVENPSVFDQLVERLRHVDIDGRPTIVCTNGWLNLADRHLLGRLVDGGARIRYSGDFDVSGLAIAALVLERYAPVAELWRMSPEEYRAALDERSPELDPDQLMASSRVAPELVAEMRVQGRAAYQEAIFDLLLEDLASPAV